MLNSKILQKAMFSISAIVIIYTIAILSLAIPEISSSIQKIEEKNAKEVLKKIAGLTTNVHKELQSYKISALEKHKQELKNLTDISWSIINENYEQSKIKNIGKVLKDRGENFKKNLMIFYDKNKNRMSEDDLKKALINFTNIYRARDGIGYFWINDFEPKMIVHPIIDNLNGKYLGDYKDPNGVYLFNNMVKKCKEDSSGIVKYQWLNPKTKVVEDKISYVFTFKPFNWIIGTGEYLSVLQNELKEKTKRIVKKLRYGDDGYFWINDFEPKMVMHPFKPELEGKSLIDFKDPKGKYLFNEMTKTCKIDNEGYVRYHWPKPNYDFPQPKISFVKAFPKWNWIIGTGVYINNIDKEVAYKKQKLLNRLKDIVAQTKVGRTGYLFIFDSSGNMLIHPDKNFEGKNVSEVKNPGKKTFLFEDLKAASKLESKALYYKWNKSDDKNNFVYEKLSWVEYVPEFDWYIASSAYLSEFSESSIEIEKYIYELSFIVLFISLILSYMFFRKLLLPIVKLSQLILKVSGGNYNLRSDIKRDDEIGVLSTHLNKMIDTNQSLIDNLSINVIKLEEKEVKLEEVS